MEVLWEAAQGLGTLLGYGTVSRFEEGTLGEEERGWSGCPVVRKQVLFTDGRRTSMIFKQADLTERLAMERLTAQKQCLPAAFSPDLHSPEGRWMALEDLGTPPPALPDNPSWLLQVEQSLTALHRANLDQGSEMPWLPRADEAYWATVTTHLSLDHFVRKMETCPAFQREFGDYLPRLQQAASQFARDMTALSQEKECLTLTHGDLQGRDGAHVYRCGGRPRLLDFGFCRYAPFYIDLAGWFSPEELLPYYLQQKERGFSLSYAGFQERAKAALRYNGFVYLFPSLMDWGEGPTEQTGRRLLQCIFLLLDGDFPEKQRHYSEALFHSLLARHKKEA